MGAERSGGGEQHGPLTAPTRRKLQAVNWCRGYALVGTDPTFPKPSSPRKRESSMPRPFDSIASALEILDHPLIADDDGCERGAVEAPYALSA